MKTISAVFKKEFRSYFTSPMGYIYLIVFLVLTNWLFLKGFFIINQANFRGLFSIFPWLFLLFVPAISMRLWAEEKKLRTIEVVFTLPVKEHEVLIGKFLAAFAFLSISVLLTLPLPITTALLGKPDWGQIVSGYIGSLLLGAAYLSIGLFASALSENQIVAFILGSLFCFILFVVGEDFVLMSLPSWISPFLQYFGLGYHFDSILRGVIDSRDIIYYISVISLFLFLNVRALEWER